MRLTTILFVVVAGLTSLASLRVVEAGGAINTLHRVVSWPSDDGDAHRGVHITLLGPDHLEERLYLLTPRDRRLILESRLAASDGTLEQTLKDELSGWWIRLTIESEINGETLQEFFRKWYTDETSQQELTLSTANGFLVQATAPLNGAPTASVLLVDELDKTDLMVDLSRSIPEHLRHTILFLSSSLADVPAAVSPGLVGGQAEYALLDLLSNILIDRARMRAHPRTPMILEEFHKGEGFESLRRDEVLERFATNTPDDSSDD